jgi:hypothetical protein
MSHSLGCLHDTYQVMCTRHTLVPLCAFNNPSTRGSGLLRTGKQVLLVPATQKYSQYNCTTSGHSQHRAGSPGSGGGDAGLQLPYSFTQPLVRSQCTALLPHHPHLRTGVNSDGQSWATMVAEVEDFARIRKALRACHTVNGTTSMFAGDSHTCCSRLYPGILCDLR